MDKSHGKITMRSKARLLLATVLLAGCGSREPPLAAGKPIEFWVESLTSPDAKLRKKAATKLGNVGPAHKDVLPALLRALQDRDAGVRREVIVAVVKFGPAAREALPILRDMQTRDPDLKVRHYATKAVKKLEESAPDS
jgi:HEAT repeat protein